MCYKSVLQLVWQCVLQFELQKVKVKEGGMEDMV